MRKLVIGLAWEIFESLVNASSDSFDKLVESFEIFIDNIEKKN